MTSSLSSKNRRATSAQDNRALRSLAVAHTNPATTGIMAGNATTASCAGEKKQYKLTKLLLNVNIQNSLGPVHVVMPPENTVGELIRVAIEIYVKEKRRPLLPSSDPLCYELHYSQFSLENLKRGESGEFGMSKFLSLFKAKHFIIMCQQSKGNAKITSINKTLGFCSITISYYKL